jgi:2-polyprenyl-3-methyl-5-hydroxy-6-metoxy-1,4-benzoquinol methylase
MREITRKNYIKNREAFIVDKCKNKKVLHLGCCDSPYTEFKFSKEIALFQRIEKVCKAQKGLDIDKAAIKYLHGIGFKDVVFFDLNQPGDVNFEPEVIVFADTLEHLMNLETALSSLKRLMNEETELIITVPNGTMFFRIKGNFLGKIEEHKDHKVSFNYSSLKQLLNFNGLKVDNILLASELNIDDSRSFEHEKSFSYKLLRGFYLAVYKLFSSAFPLFSECLIMTCRLDTKPK